MSVLGFNRNVQSLLRLTVILIAAHSIILGIILMAAPVQLLSLFGWSIDCHRFFLQQAGVFHILLGFVYLIEFFAYQNVRALLIGKGMAVLFLSIQYVWFVPELGVLLSDCIDASMAVLTLLLWLRAPRQDTER